jgi:hypothetical protein
MQTVANRPAAGLIRDSRLSTDSRCSRNRWREDPDAEAAVTSEVLGVEGQNGGDSQAEHQGNQPRIVNLNPTDGEGDYQVSPALVGVRRFRDSGEKLLDPEQVLVGLGNRLTEAVPLPWTGHHIPAFDEILRRYLWAIAAANLDHRFARGRMERVRRIGKPDQDVGIDQAERQRSLIRDRRRALRASRLPAVKSGDPARP